MPLLWVSLSLSLGLSGPILEPLWASLGPAGRLGTYFGAPLGVSGLILEPLLRVSLDLYREIKAHLGVVPNPGRALAPGPDVRTLHPPR